MVDNVCTKRHAHNQCNPRKGYKQCRVASHFDGSFRVSTRTWSRNLPPLGQKRVFHLHPNYSGFNWQHCEHSKNHDRCDGWSRQPATPTPPTSAIVRHSHHQGQHLWSVFRNRKESKLEWFFVLFGGGARLLSAEPKKYNAGHFFAAAVTERFCCGVISEVLEKNAFLGPLLFDMFLVLVFVAQHSLMATETWKDIVNDFGLQHLSRTLYCLATSFALQVDNSTWKDAQIPQNKDNIRLTFEKLNHKN